MDIHSLSSAWPYEHRFELAVRGSLLAAPLAVWSTAIELASCSIVSSGKTPTCHYYLLARGVLIVFDRRAVFASSSEVGLMDAASYLVAALEEKQPVHASLTRHHPVDEDLLSLAVCGLDESLLPPITAKLDSGTIHTWPLQALPHERPPQSLTLLMHGPSSSVTAPELRASISEVFPEFLVSCSTRDNGVCRVTAVGYDQYIAIQSTPLLYASVELSVTTWSRAEEIISKMLLHFRPDIVAPIWHGDPLGAHHGTSCNNDELL